MGLLLAVVGLSWLFLPRLRWFKAWVLIAVVLVTNLLFAFFYQVADQEVFLLPVFLCAALFSGGGLALLLRRLPDGWTVTGCRPGCPALAGGRPRSRSVGESGQ